jgi:hypothetical protein
MNFARRLVWVVAVFVSSVSFAVAADVFELGDRRELFVDRHQIESMSGSARLKLHTPEPAEVAIKFDAPWELGGSAFVTVFADGNPLQGGKVRMYYRGLRSNLLTKEPKSGPEVACYAESTDGGRTFVKPKLGLFEFDGSKENNIVWPERAHNFTPFKDTRPGVPADELYKALSLRHKKKEITAGLLAYYSADGIHWRLAQEEPVITDGAFDSQNVAFWDPNRSEYRSYYRVYTNGTRDIAWARSSDFQTWSKPTTIDRGAVLREHFYTNATSTYFRAPHYYFAFPKRLNYKRSGRPGFNGISDALFLSSRDGEHFDRTFSEALIRPGPDIKNWGDRGTMPAWGLIQTGPDEMSIYYSQHYREATAYIRRGVWRLDGIASLHADGTPGELVTKPFTFAGKTLTLNYATSAAGSVQVEIQTAEGEAIPGFTLADATEAFGDKIDATFAWKNGTDVTALAGKPVRLRFVVRDADVYSYRFE